VFSEIARVVREAGTVIRVMEQELIPLMPMKNVGIAKVMATVQHAAVLGSGLDFNFPLILKRKKE
jgi:hypothetical protein